MIRIDGSMGEGGGQVLRTSLALSACTGKAFSIENIRANRKKPGLMRQHLACVRAVQEICSAEVTGDAVSSQQLSFLPGFVLADEYHFAVGSAGSAMLVLQTILPPLLMAGSPSTVVVDGGTHNPMSPPFHYIDEVFLPMVNLIGGRCSTELKHWGFYPAGGGRVVVSIEPFCGDLLRMDLCRSGGLIGASVVAAVSNIPWEIAEDEASAIVKAAKFDVLQKKSITVDSNGPGNVAMIRLDFEHGSAMFTGFGELGVSRHRVASLAAKAANRFFVSQAAVDEHLADQILIPMALAGGGSFTTTEPSLHTLTNLQVIEQFLPVRSLCTRVDDSIWKIDIFSL
ncbi:MAG: RNA 3'-terminal phosphate cyclase [Erysipelotrichia bacterium]|nr:RNA 3'-terminal phosphate cyclase [Erysipelotrichia bacterium]